jgi:hypothetical protein
MCKSAGIGIALLLALSACATMPSPEEQAHIAAIAAKLQQPIPSPHKLVVDDQRPEASRKGYVLSALFFDCENGVWNIGDRQIGDRLPRLETDLLTAFGDAVQGQRLAVRQYAIYLNGRAALETEATNGTTGLLAQMMKPGPILRAKCEHSQMTAGWFDTNEIENNFSPIIIEMDVSLNGEEFLVRSVYSPEVETWQAFDNNSLTPIMTVSVQAAISKADAALVTEIKKRHLEKVG